MPEHKLVLEHDGYYYHSSMAARERAERKDRALREAGYQMLRICDSRELAEPVVLQKTKILYRFDEQDRHLDQMIASVFCYLDLPPLDFHHRRDQYAINQMYFHERKKRTLAVEYPAIAWSGAPATPTSLILYSAVPLEKFGGTVQNVSRSIEQRSLTGPSAVPTVRSVPIFRHMRKTAWQCSGRKLPRSGILR